MRYDETLIALGAGADDAEMRKVLTDVAQSPAGGIVDGPTGTPCNAAYWEREYSVVDAVVALYKALSGADTQGTMSLLGNLTVTNTSVGIASDLTADSLTVDNDITSTLGDLIVKNANLDSGAGRLDLGKMIIDDAGVDTGIWAKERYLSGKIGTESKFIYFELGSLRINLPYTDADYQSWGEGGNFRIGGPLTILDINQRGAMGIGGHEIDDVSAPASITVMRRDAYGSAGSSFLRAKTLPTDDRDSSSYLIEDMNSHSIDPATKTGIKLSTNRASNNLVEFIFDDIVKASFDEDGLLSAVSATLSDYLVVNGQSYFDGIMNITADINCPSRFINNIGGSFVGGDVQLGGWIQAAGYIYSGSELNRYAKLYGNTLDQFVDFKDVNNYNFQMGLFDGGVNGNAYILGNFNTLVCQAGPTLGSPTGEFLFDIQSAGTSSGGVLFTHSAEVFQLFVDKSGVVKSSEVGSFPTGFGPSTTGHTRVPFPVGVIDSGDQSALDIAIATVSAKNKGALVVVDDVACGPSLFSAKTPSGIWEPVTMQKKNVYEHLAAEADHILAAGEDIIHNVRTLVAVSTLTLPDLQTVKDRVVHIKDAGFNSASFNITVQTESTALIEGNATLVINTNGTAISLYCDGTDWFIF